MQRRRVPNCHQALKAWNRHRLHQVKMRLDPSIPMTVPKRLMSSRWTEVDLVKFHQLSAHRRTKEVTRGTGARTCGSVFRCEYCGRAFWDSQPCTYHDNYIHGKGRWHMNDLKDAIHAAKLAGKHTSAMHLEAIYEKNKYTGKSYTL